GLAFQHQVEVEVFGDGAGTEGVIGIEHQPAAGFVLEDVEAQLLRVDAQAELAAGEQGLLAGKPDQRGDAPPLGLRIIVADDVVDGRHGGGGEHRHEHHDDQDLDQREAAITSARADWGPGHGQAGQPSDQLPMSALMPSPPGWPSAPEEKMSIWPRRPGLRYW